MAENKSAKGVFDKATVEKDAITGDDVGRGVWVIPSFSKTGKAWMFIADDKYPDLLALDTFEKGDNVYIEWEAVDKRGSKWPDRFLTKCVKAGVPSASSGKSNGAWTPRFLDTEEGQRESEKWRRERQQIDRESIERQTSLKEAVSVFVGSPWQEGETFDRDKAVPVILEMAAVFLEFIQNSPESVIRPAEGEDRAHAEPTPSPSPSKQIPLEGDSDIGVNEFWKDATELAKAQGKTAPDLATTALGMSALEYAEKHSWGEALEAVKAHCKEEK